MKTAIRGVLLGGLLCAAGGLFGCEAYIDPGYPGEPAPAAYTYGPGYDYYYYDSGWYDGPYWYWRDRDGHMYHELREAHEHRAYEFRNHPEYRQGRFEGRTQGHYEGSRGGATHYEGGHASGGHAAGGGGHGDGHEGR